MHVVWAFRQHALALHGRNPPNHGPSTATPLRPPDEPSAETKQQKLDELLDFLGADPIEKMERAFRARFDSGVKEYLGL